MTRYARSKGSKSSNERLPNEPTPWHIMKQDLEFAIQRDEEESKKKTKSAKVLLQEKEADYTKYVHNIKTDWAEFEDVESSVNNNNVTKKKVKKKSVENVNNEKKLIAVENGKDNSEIRSKTSSENLKNKSGIKKVKRKKIDDSIVNSENKSDIKKVKKNKTDNSIENSENKPNTSSENLENKSDIKKVKKKKRDNPIENSENKSDLKKVKRKKTDNSVENSENKSNIKKIKRKKIDDSIDNSEIKSNTPLENIQLENTRNIIKKKQKLKTKKDSNCEIAEQNNDKIINSESTFYKDGENKKQKKTKVKTLLKNNKVIENNEEKNESENNSNETEQSVESKTVLSKRQKRNRKALLDNQANKSDAAVNDKENDSFDSRKKRAYEKYGKVLPKKFLKKTAKTRDDNVHSRRKKDTGSFKLTINGIDVEIVKYDGFPILKKDSERLIELRKEMVLKGIPKADIDAAMKLERRKCEKNLTRIKKQVCFHCRKSGHNLSDCPELDKEETVTGICFKCGSTEHTHFECKVRRGDEYSFAKCFICREQGHIAKQCPDNPKGLYPDGGACKICGDVTHLKKDCPDIMREKEETTITVDKINDKNLETLDNERIKLNQVKESTKIIKF